MAAGLVWDAVQRLSFYTSALLDGSITPDHVLEDWPDWYQLVPAFVATYGSEELQELYIGAEFLGAVEEDEDVSLTEADLAYLKTMETWLDMYLEIRTTKSPIRYSGKCPIDGGETVSGCQVQIPGGCRDIGMACSRERRNRLICAGTGLQRIRHGRAFGARTAFDRHVLEKARVPEGGQHTCRRRLTNRSDSSQGAPSHPGR